MSIAFQRMFLIWIALNVTFVGAAQAIRMASHGQDRAVHHRCP
jgi:hypothetical protein